MEAILKKRKALAAKENKYTKGVLKQFCGKSRVSQMKGGYME